MSYYQRECEQAMRVRIVKTPVRREWTENLQDTKIREAVVIKDNYNDMKLKLKLV